MQSARMEWHGDAATDRARAGAVAGLWLGVEHILGASNAVVPLEEGTLERSGNADVDEASLTGAVSYDTVYAVRQHEELTWRHAPGRTAKYLEGPMVEEAATVHALIAAAVRRAMQ